MMYRPQRPTLGEALKASIEFKDRAAMVAHLDSEMAQWGGKVTDRDIRVEKYKFDSRCGWDTHLVLMRNIRCQHKNGEWGFFGGLPSNQFYAIGYTDGPCEHVRCFAETEV